MKILIVKKSQLNASMLCSFLNRQGHQVVISNNVIFKNTNRTDFKPELVISEDLIYPEILRTFCSSNQSSRKENFSIIIFTSQNTRTEILSILQGGCQGIIHHDDEIENIFECIKFINNGYKYVSPTIRKHIIFEGDHIDLTPAEIEIARRILVGQSTKEIAESLCRSIETIQNHRSSIKSKLGIRGGKLAFYQTLLGVALQLQK
jgi:DNA-binding NarL/FixJ family response regulator